MSENQQRALRVAAEMIAAGIPVFAAPPCPAANGGTCSRPGHTGRQEYDLPAKWQLTVPSTVWLEKWQPGWALAAVQGHVSDALDEDPRNGGDASIAELTRLGHMPRVYGVSETPSGGRHYLIAPLGERKGILMPGLDYQGGAPDGQGRGLIWIAPTVRRSKSAEHLGQRRPYRWLQEPDLTWLREASPAEFGGDGTGEMIVARLRATKNGNSESHRDDRLPRVFTESEAKRFVQPHLDKLAKAQIGEIEESANAAAVVLSRFVPGVWSAEVAYNVLTAVLSETAYDPAHPASTWHADKFRDVVAGRNGRAPGGWLAELRAEPDMQVSPCAGDTGDAADALLAEMLRPAELMSRPPQPYLVKTLLNMNSVAWLIGAPGSKKSFVALDMAAHVAAGRPWQGLRVRQGRVVLIVAEGAGGIGGRLKAWELEHGPISDDVYVLPRPVQSGNPAAWAVLVEACRRLAPVLVVADTQARVTVGLEENSATDMGVFVDALGAIQQATGGCVLPIHHTGRNGQDARGSSALDGAQDSELKVVATDEALRGELRVEKQKDLPSEGSVLPLTFRVHVVGVDEDGKPVTSLALSAPDAFQGSETTARAAEPGQETHVSEPVAGDWTWELVPHQNSHNVRRILVVLAEVGGEAGLTKAETCRIVRSRWYGGRPLKKKEKGHLSEETWARSWDSARGLTAGDGEVVLVNEGTAERWRVNPSVLSGLP